MNEYDHILDLKVVIRHCVLISWFCEFVLTLSWYMNIHLLHHEYDQTFDPIVIIGYCDLFSWFSDFSVWHQGQGMYEHDKLGYESNWPYY